MPLSNNNPLFNPDTIKEYIDHLFENNGAVENRKEAIKKVEYVKRELNKTARRSLPKSLSFLVGNERKEAIEMLGDSD